MITRTCVNMFNFVVMNLCTCIDSMHFRSLCMYIYCNVCTHFPVNPAILNKLALYKGIYIYMYSICTYVMYMYSMYM